MFDDCETVGIKCECRGTQKQRGVDVCDGHELGGFASLFASLAAVPVRGSAEVGPPLQ
jgi:hypothetical protein